MNFKKDRSTNSEHKESMTVNTTANLKKAHVKKVIKTGGKATGTVLKKSLQWISNILLTLLLIFTIAGIIVGVTFFNFVRTYLVDEDYDIQNLKTSLDQTTKTYYKLAEGDEAGEEDEIFVDTDGSVWVEMVDERIYGSENRSYVKYSEMPKMLIDAFVAIEDERYWSHSGVDWKRTFGAVLEFAGGNDSYGGSTITQQLIKNTTGEDETTIQRKVTEIFRALTLSKKRSKTEVLEMYLNTIHLSRRNYGVQAASNYYFGKDVSELDLVECAALAAIPKSPTKYDPVKNPDENKKRRNTVLDKMLELEWITKEQHDEAVNTDIVINTVVLDGSDVESNSYFKDALIEQIISDLCTEYDYTRKYASDLVYSGGLQIFSTIDPEIQKIMEEVFTDPETFQKVSEGIQPESAMVVMDPFTGDVLGIVGGREKTGDRDLNRATQSKRQIGSSIKPLTVYAPAMDLGLINYSTVIDDTPVEYNEELERYWPKNANDKYDGFITVNRAVEASKNTTAIKVLQELTTDYSYNFAKNKLRLNSLVTSDKDLAPLALGGLTHGLTVLEVAAAYSIFPNSGVYSAPRLYTKVLQNDGTVLLENRIDQEYAISSDTAAVMTKIMQNVVTNGTAAAITLDQKINVAGKTGSTNDDKDRYFAGYTPYYVGACWFGYDIPKYLGKFRSNPAMIAWEKVMERIHEDIIEDANKGNEPLKTFFEPDDDRLVKSAYCLDSGMAPTEACTRDIRGSRVANGWYTKSQVPTETCTAHTYIDWDSSTGMVATPYCPEDVIMKVALVNADNRNFPHNLAINDAGYTARSEKGDPDNVINESDPYYASTLNGLFAGYAPTGAVPPNAYCTLHKHAPEIDDDITDDSQIDDEPELNDGFARPEVEDDETSSDIPENEDDNTSENSEN